MEQVGADYALVERLGRPDGLAQPIRPACQLAFAALRAAQQDALGTQICPAQRENLPDPGPQQVGELHHDGEHVGPTALHQLKFPVLNVTIPALPGEQPDVLSRVALHMAVFNSPAEHRPYELQLAVGCHRCAGTAIPVLRERGRLERLEGRLAQGPAIAGREIADCCRVYPVGALGAGRKSRAFKVSVQEPPQAATQILATWLLLAAMMSRWMAFARSGPAINSYQSHGPDQVSLERWLAYQRYRPSGATNIQRVADNHRLGIVGPLSFCLYPPQCRRRRSLWVRPGRSEILALLHAASPYLGAEWSGRACFSESDDFGVNMEYSFCGGNWDCWYGWLWSSATAAWVQALFSLLAIAFALGMWRHDRQASLDSEDHEFQRNMAVAKTAFALCMASLKRLKGDYSPPQFSATRRTIEKMEGELLDVVRAGLPNADIMAFVYGKIARLNEIIQFLEDTPTALARSQTLNEPPVHRRKRLEVDKQIEEFRSDMLGAHDEVQRYQMRHLDDPLAPWGEPQEDDAEMSEDQRSEKPVQPKE